ncbi:MAG: hypothetical protein RIC95_14155 [Vicingaceae bacterium]
MKTLLISYSLSGNNEAVANRIAKQLPADHLQLTESSKRGFFRISIDLIFNRTPKVQPTAIPMEDYDFVVLIGPVWMGKIAFPLRSCLSQLKKNLKPYAFVSVCGGSNGKHPTLEVELLKRTGIEPTAVIEMHIANLLPQNVEPSYKAINAYQLTDEDFDQLSLNVIEQLKTVLDKM